MTEVEKLKAIAAGFNVVPPGAVLHPLTYTASGEGGEWQAAFWIAGFNQFIASIVPVGGGCPVALTPVWTDIEVCMGAARKLAHLASESA